MFPRSAVVVEVAVAVAVGTSGVVRYSSRVGIFPLPAPSARSVPGQAVAKTAEVPFFDADDAAVVSLLNPSEEPNSLLPSLRRRSAGGYLNPTGPDPTRPDLISPAEA